MSGGIMWRVEGRAHKLAVLLTLLGCACAGTIVPRLCFYGARDIGDTREKPLEEYAGPLGELEVSEAHVGEVVVKGIWTVILSLERRSYDRIVAWMRANPDRDVALALGGRIIARWPTDMPPVFEQQPFYARLTFATREEAEELLSELLASRALR